MAKNGFSRRAAIGVVSGAVLSCRALAEPSFDSIRHAAAAAIPRNLSHIQCSAGSGAGIKALFVADTTVDVDFVAAHSAASFIAADGRGFRLDDSAISVEFFGAVGDGISNDQPAIQAAIRFAEAVGARLVSFQRASYAVYCPERRLPVHVNSSEGHSIVITRQITLQGLSGRGSTLLYRNVDGEGLAQKWQVVGDAVWRGGGIFLKGLEVRPADPKDLPSATLIDLTLDGGCDRTGYYGYPARLTDGDGWDETHKGLWAQNDRVTGDWHLIRCKIVRFRGELFYQGGSDHGAFVGRNIVMGQTNADILNPCGSNLDIVGGFFYDGNSGWEGWGGRHGRLLNCRFERCRSMGGIQGGRADTGKRYFTPHRFEDGVDPWLTLDVVIVNCGQVSIGNWVRGKVTIIDCFIYLSTSVFPTLHDVNLDVIALADRKSLGAAVALTGGAALGSEPLGRIRIRLSVGATKRALTAGLHYSQPVAWGGSLGPDIVIDVQTNGPINQSRATFRAVDVEPVITTRKVSE